MNPKTSKSKPKKCADCGIFIKKGREGYINAKVLCQRCWSREKFNSRMKRNIAKKNKSWMDELYEKAGKK